MLEERINNILIHDPDRANQFQELADYQAEHYPLNPYLSKPSDLPIKHTLPDYIEEVDPEIVKEMTTPPQHQKRIV